MVPNNPKAITMLGLDGAEQIIIHKIRDIVALHCSTPSNPIPQPHQRSCAYTHTHAHRDNGKYKNKYECKAPLQESEHKQK